MKNLIFAIAIALSPSAFAEKKPAADTKLASELAVPPNEVTVGVKGMVCAFCAQGIEKNFMSHKEVAKVLVSLENKFVKITFKEGQTLSRETITQILKDAGYEAVFKS